MSTDHPVHPATIHFPIAFLSASWMLDLVHLATTKIRPSYLVRTLGPNLPELAKASHYMNVVGLLSMIPAVLTGGQQAWLIYSKGGLYEADGKTIRPKMKLVMLHAAINDLVLLAAGYSWYARRENTGLLPDSTNFLISALAMPAFFFSANLGGTLTYNYGVGMNLAKKPKTG